MFHTCLGIFTKLHISRHICPHWDSDILKELRNREGKLFLFPPQK